MARIPKDATEKKKVHKRPEPTSATKIPQGDYIWDSALKWISKKIGG